MSNQTVIQGDFSSADASALTEANSRFTIRNPATAGTITIDGVKSVIVTDLEITVGAALTVQVYDGANATVDAGEKIVHQVLAAAGTYTIPFHTPRPCQLGTYPKVKTSGPGQVDVILRGVVSQ